MTEDERNQNNKATLLTMVTLLAYRKFASVALMVEACSVRNACPSREVTNAQLVAWAQEELAHGQVDLFGGRS
jgi:hypothetical protein